MTARRVPISNSIERGWRNRAQGLSDLSQGDPLFPPTRGLLGAGDQLEPMQPIDHLAHRFQGHAEGGCELRRGAVTRLRNPVEKRRGRPAVDSRAITVGGNLTQAAEGPDMADIIHDSFSFTDLPLQRGGALPQVTLAFVARGRLAPGGRNAILVTHGYTSGPRMIEPGAGSSEGAWSTLVGPGAPIDTDRYFVVCCNMLGSSFGSTNATSIDPRSGKRYGSKFPKITVTDIVTAQKRLLEHLGVTHLRAVVGPSYGGFQAFQWAVTFPDFIGGIAPVVTSPLPPRSNRIEELLKWFDKDPNWNGGDYYDAGGVRQTLTALRVDTLTRYGRAASLSDRFPDPAARDAELRRVAAAWADVFDANSLFILGDAMDTYDVAKDYARIKVPVLYVLSRTDMLFPPSLAPGVIGGLRAAGVEAEYVEIDSEHGHLASGADATKWAPALREFIARLEARDG
ncbi:MAG TPA: alpha/beta fold hydrolase [Rhodopila sp.]|jgi:homoserine O-acetyltransferase